MTVLSAEELRDATCLVCPAQQLPVGAFDVVEHPSSRNRLVPEVGYRRDRVHGAPVCAHPFRVGLPAGAYVSEGVPLPVDDGVQEPPMPTRQDLEVPTQVEDLEAWIIAVLRAAGPSRMTSALAAAEAIAAGRFEERDVVTAMRRVLTVELAAAADYAATS